MSEEASGMHDALHGLGGPDCHGVFRAYTGGRRDAATVRHVKDCHFCHFMLIGDIPEWLPLTRRRWFKATAAAVGLMTLAGATAVVRRRFQTRVRSRADIVQGQSLDAVFAAQGMPGIAALIDPATATLEDSLEAVDWIAERRLRIMYNDLVFAFGDPRIEIRVAAVGAAGRLAAVDFKPYQSLLDGFAAAETDKPLRQTMKRFADKVRNA